MAEDEHPPERTLDEHRRSESALQEALRLRARIDAGDMGWSAAIDALLAAGDFTRHGAADMLQHGALYAAGHSRTTQPNLFREIDLSALEAPHTGIVLPHHRLGEEHRDYPGVRVAPEQPLA